MTTNGTPEPNEPTEPREPANPNDPTEFAGSTESDGRFVIGEDVFDLFEDSSSRGGGGSPSSASVVAASAAPAVAQPTVPPAMPVVTPVRGAMVQSAPAAVIDEAFFDECQREMVTELVPLRVRFVSAFGRA